MKRIQKFTVYPETHIKAVVTNDGNLELTLDKTKNEVVEELIGLAPLTLDTLEEIANAINNDGSFATTIDNALKNKANSADLATVATSGSYDDLSNKPTNVSAFTNDAGYLTLHQDISGKADKTYVDGIADDFNVKERVVAEALVDLAARIEALENNNN